MNDEWEPVIFRVRKDHYSTLNCTLIYFLGYQFISNEHNSETARWKKYIGQGVWECAWNGQALSKHTAFPYSHMLTNPAAPP